MPKHSLTARRRINRRGMHLRAEYGDDGAPFMYRSGWLSISIQPSGGLANLPALIPGPPPSPVPVLSLDDLTQILVHAWVPHG